MTGFREPQQASSCSEIPQVQDETLKSEGEIGLEPLSDAVLEEVSKNLEMVPPVLFDVSRQVRVFEPYIQYVDIKLLGCAIERHRVNLPRTIVNIAANQKIENRLRTTFNLIERSSEVSSKALEEELRNIREMYAKSLGKPWGRVLLRKRRPEFDKRIEKFRETMNEHEKKVRATLQQHLDKSLAQVVDYYLPTVMESQPEALLAQIMTPKPTKEQARAWLERELSRSFPLPEDLLKNMVLECQFRDVTYETLNEPGFADALQKAFPHVDWDKPFSEFNAAKSRAEQTGTV